MSPEKEPFRFEIRVETIVELISDPNKPTELPVRNASSIRLSVPAEIKSRCFKQEGGLLLPGIHIALTVLCSGLANVYEEQFGDDKTHVEEFFAPIIKDTIAYIERRESTTVQASGYVDRFGNDPLSTKN